jgi:hypothetical protein
MKAAEHLGLFDAEYYFGRLGFAVGDALRHFQEVGDRMGLDPSPYFSTLFYKARHPDWASQGATSALQDFLQRENGGRFRQAHPMIDPLSYLARYPDVAAAGVSPTIHFAQHGDAEGRVPSDDFDAAFYARCYLPLGQTGAFAHYARSGQAAGLLPKPLRRSAAETVRAVQAALVALKKPIVLALHDAQLAGTPILLCDMAAGFARRGLDPIFVLQNGGPIMGRMRGMGPVLLVAEGWDEAALFAALPPKTKVLVNSAAAAGLGQSAAAAGHRTLLLIHEMREYLAQQKLIPTLRKAREEGARLIASFPSMADTLRDDLGQVEVLLPGLPLPATPLSAFRQARGRFKGKTVYIGAGHADRRKGFDLFLQAAWQLHAGQRNAVFVWLGARDAWAQDLADKAMAEGLPLILPGFVEDALAWYQAADAYLLTSRQDPGPATALHAAAVGTEFVGFDLDIGMKPIVGGVLGQFIPAGDFDAYVRAATKAARAATAQTRRLRRAQFRRLSDFEAYIDALLARLSDPPAKDVEAGPNL